MLLGDKWIIPDRIIDPVRMLTITGAKDYIDTNQYKLYILLAYRPNFSRKNSAI